MSFNESSTRGYDMLQPPHLMSPFQSAFLVRILPHFPSAVQKGSSLKFLLLQVSRYTELSVSAQIWDDVNRRHSDL